ncbi:purine-binding chemotaxis protein CheW [Rhodocytophaga rosea]|uniref:Purine-binding chemotaxis protein CheW n=1 Tax=Rhodocytophaga rosea TaxID=2704465 RepID=A0A6C0GJ24_9BACT|nr:chemotaxis protein CheW [Rhodocytophaga rosea]QHT67720.1 purine-binding chemotaxis protein CheW [Rhodocytophaga rosea]
MEIKEEGIVTKASSHKENEKFNRHQLIVFKQGNEEYGLAIDQIKEVVLTPKITKMPQTPHYVKGVANIRGNIIAIIDLEEKFGITDKNTEINTEGKYTLVVASEEFKVGILVKEVPNTLAVSQSDIDETVNIIQDEIQESNYIKGIVKVNNRLIILIDIYQIMSKQELNQVIRK